MQARWISARPAPSSRRSWASDFSPSRDIRDCLRRRSGPRLCALWDWPEWCLRRAPIGNGHTTPGAEDDPGTSRKKRHLLRKARFPHPSCPRRGASRTQRAWIPAFAVMTNRFQRINVAPDLIGGICQAAPTYGPRLTAGVTPGACSCNVPNSVHRMPGICERNLAAISVTDDFAGHALGGVT